MSEFIDNTEWEEYEDIINEFHKDAFQQEIIWYRTIAAIDKNGNDSNKRIATPITLKGLIMYNHFRSWPISKETETGQLDHESLLVFFNLAYLKELGYTNTKGQFKYEPSLDYFVINGLRYTDKGNSQTAQAKDKTLLHFLVLKREELKSHENPY